MAKNWLWRRMTILGTLAVAMIVLVACGGDAAPAKSLKGRTFLSHAVTVDGQTKQLVTGTNIRLTFFDDGRITASAGCNILSGSVHISDDRLVVNDLGSTEMGCDAARHAQDEWLASVLSSWPTYELDGSHLVLRTDTATIEFVDREVADPDRPLLSTIWSVDGLVDKSSVSTVPAGSAATVRFAESEVQIVIDACNEGSASAKIGPSSIEVGRFALTDVACADAAARLEAAIIAALNGKVDYAVEAATLRLTNADGKGLMLKAQ